MKNLSGNANWVISELEELKEIKKEIIDDRTILSYMSNDVSFFLSSDGKPLVFKNIIASEKYIKKNNLENYEIDNFQDFDFDGIELIEL